MTPRFGLMKTKLVFPLVVTGATIFSTMGLACAAFGQRADRILVGGLFSMLGGQPRQWLGRLHPDGRVDDSFDPGASDDDPFIFGGVWSLAVQPDGMILVGGYFHTLAGASRHHPKICS